MAAAVVINAAGLRNKTFNSIERAARRQKREHLLDGGIFAFDTGSLSVAATSVDDNDDVYLAYQFPAGAKLIDFEVTLGDFDSATTAVFDHQVSAADGSTGAVVLINASTVGRSAGSVQMTVSAGNYLLDVGSLYLGFKMEAGAAAGAQAATVRYKGLYWMGALTTPNP